MIACGHYAVLFTDKTKLLSHYHIKGKLIPIVCRKLQTVIYAHQSHLMPTLLLARTCEETFDCLAWSELMQTLTLHI